MLSPPKGQTRNLTFQHGVHLIKYKLTIVKFLAFQLELIFHIEQVWNGVPQTQTVYYCYTNVVKGHWPRHGL